MKTAVETVVETAVSETAVETAVEKVTAVEGPSSVGIPTCPR